MSSRIALFLALLTGGIALLPANAQEGGLVSGPVLGAVKVSTGEAVYRSNLQPLYPVIRLGHEERLDISFDLLGEDEKQLYYRVRHHEADWKSSDLLPSEYLNGFDTDRLAMPIMSAGTLQPYAHYRLFYPTTLSSPSVSGNYSLEVYRWGQESSPLLSIRFSVLEPSSLTISEDSSLSPTSLHADKAQTHQQINLKVVNPDWASYSRGEVKVVILPNGHWADALTLGTPSIDNATLLSYIGQDAPLFPAGNEYHKLEHLSVFEGGLGIESTTKGKGLVEQKLYTLPIQQEYVHREDLNGRSFVYSLDATEKYEIDYHLMTFSLRSPEPLPSDIILEGQYFAYHPRESKTLRYDSSQGVYTLTLPVKMGYQEYQYRLSPSSGSSVSPISKEQSYIEGNYKQTTNEYIVLVYERKPSDRADRLIGFTTLVR